jgi:hypothetical protein
MLSHRTTPSGGSIFVRVTLPLSTPINVTPTPNKEVALSLSVLLSQP